MNRLFGIEALVREPDRERDRDARRLRRGTGRAQKAHADAVKKLLAAKLRRAR